jgi:hypothetical protein
MASSLHIIQLISQQLVLLADIATVYGLDVWGSIPNISNKFVYTKQCTECDMLPSLCEARKHILCWVL